ncbi:MAG: DUF3536 domain-containing protein [Desulfobacca sp.]|uniref:DUF3536 domain-containing protein n=1 Tax=Desulfobacca sp. TaxID=2067990 RepID=UPI00404AB89D
MVAYICIHGHFYQPPRENPWLEAIEIQDSAYPYHDWNERITAECYAPNYASRILDGYGNIVKIPNNYEEISFNFGPTLLSWLEANAPEVYRRILLADERSRERYGGHGSALAQAYNHLIMPLAHARDKYTQVLWGIKDFQHRFGRDPEGMWLPETAVDLETLDIMAALGIKFTILAPRQARRVRPLTGGDWTEVSGERIDPTRAYLQRLPSGRSIALFFYDGPIAKAVAFENLLQRGEYLAERLLGARSPHRSWPQLIHIATDGETFGHHHRHGDMALAYALDYLKSLPDVRLTNYGEYLERHPPQMEVEIYEHSSWSCVHGVERWRADCGCRTGLHPGWHQGWRQPLRQALDWLRDALAPLYEAKAGRWFVNPWGARNEYIRVILDRTPETIRRFLAEQSGREVAPADWPEVLCLLEMQRAAMLMYTSCGWFFDELSGLETLQILLYAGRALQLAKQLFDVDLEPRFLDRLEKAPSNLPQFQNGRYLYETFVRPTVVDLLEVGAHYAISSLFEEYGQRDRIFCFDIEQLDYRRAKAGRATLATGRVNVTSRITYNTAEVSFAVLHLGDHNLAGGVRYFQGPEAYGRMVAEIQEVFASADIPETIRLMDRHFGTDTYSLRYLFRDEQRRVLDKIMASTLQEVGVVFRQLFKNHVPLMRFLADLRVPLPRGLRTAAELVINLSLKDAFTPNELNLEHIAALLAEARRFGVEPDAQTLEYTLRQTAERLAADLRQDPDHPERLRQLTALVEMAATLPFEINFWSVQNICYDLLQRVYPARAAAAHQGDAKAQVWVANFLALAQKVRLAVPLS